MKPLFADTSFYVALLNSRDLMHVKALQVGDYFHRPVLLTDFVLLELGNVLSSVGQRGLFSKLTDRLRSDPNVRIVAASRDLLDKGLRLFSRREDKEWSLTDCTSFVIMQEEDLTEALTTDHHFEQAGFTVLLR
ncbi:MAG: PIN domain-containing protein [Thermoguttaceae bacterium]|jgi:predicted nucleic acid-binding protein